MSRDQAAQLAREYIPWDREFGRRAFARRFRTSVSKIDYWLDIKRFRPQSPEMNLTDDEKRDAAMGCRSLAYRALEDAKGAENPGVRANFEATAKRFTELAAKFEAARGITTPNTQTERPARR